jgi:group I intron endonuclease
MIGIYKIQNSYNNKIYIGSSSNIPRRWADHIYLLNKGIHHSKHLQHAWNKHGSKAFTFKLIENCNEESLLSREQHYLDTLLKANDYINNKSNFFIKNGYNIKPFAENNKGFKISESSIQKMLKSKKVKQVVAIDINNNKVYKFLSTGYAAAYFNIKPNVVRKSIFNKTTCKSLIDVGFIYEENYNENFIPKKYVIHNKGLKQDNSNLCKSIYVVNIVTKTIKKFESIKECAIFYKTYSGNIIKRMKKSPKYYRKNNVYKNLRFFYSLNECKDIV